MEACEKAGANPIHKRIVDQIIAVDNFMAFKKKMTIVELFCTTILRLLNLQEKDGLITNLSALDKQTMIDQR